MLGMYRDEDGVRCLPFSGGLITVRSDGEVCQVSLHTNHYLNDCRDTLTYTDAVYGITMWTLQCHVEYLEPTIMKLIDRYQDVGARETVLRIAGAADRKVYQAVHSKAPDVPVSYIHNLRGQSADAVLEHWARETTCVQYKVREEGATWRRLNLDGFECTYREFMAAAERLWNSGVHLPISECLDELKASIARWR